MTVPHVSLGRSLRYKFVELSLVTDDSLERAVNEWVARGWQLERIQFVTSESSRRPVMAFVAFVREDEAVAHGEAAHGEAAHGEAAHPAFEPPAPRTASEEYRDDPCTD